MSDLRERAEALANPDDAEFTDRIRREGQVIARAYLVALARIEKLERVATEAQRLLQLDAIRGGENVNCLNACLDALEAENLRLREALSAIALYGLSSPREMGENDGNFRNAAYSMVGIAARALARTSPDSQRSGEGE